MSFSNVSDYLCEYLNDSLPTSDPSFISNRNIDGILLSGKQKERASEAKQANLMRVVQDRASKEQLSTKL